MDLLIPPNPRRKGDESSELRVATLMSSAADESKNESFICTPMYIFIGSRFSSCLTERPPLLRETCQALAPAATYKAESASRTHIGSSNQFGVAATNCKSISSRPLISQPVKTRKTRPANAFCELKMGHTE
jgi:hypothetical protein